MFVGALLGTAVVASAGLVAYDKFLRPKPEVIETPAKPPPSDLTLVDTPKPDPALKKERARQAREMIVDGDAALGANEFDRAVSRYLGAYEIDPAPGVSKRIALAYLLKADPPSANKWLKVYVKDAKGESDATLVERYLRSTPEP